MAYSRRDGSSYLDGIHVKISEKFRPPRKVVLPVTFHPSLSPDVLSEDYDFSVETKALAEAEQYRKEEEAKVQARVDKVASDIEEFTKSTSSEQPNRQIIPNGDIDFRNSIQPGVILLPQSVVSEDKQLQATRTKLFNGELGNKLINTIQPGSILQPQLLGSQEQLKPKNNSSNKSFSLAEFENDISSPFDYMELQTINDLEELNSVFQGMSVMSAPPTNGSNVGDPSKLNTSTSVPANHSSFATSNVSYPGFSHDPFYRNFENDQSRVELMKAMNLHSAATCTAATNSYLGATNYTSPSVSLCQNRLRSSKSASDLQNYGDSERWENADKRSSTPPPLQQAYNVLDQGTSPVSKIDWPPNAEQLVASVTDMGFAPDRVIRAVQLHGVDGKKVVEHLCQTQTLVDAGFNVVDAEAALASYQNDLSKAAEFLRLQQQFLNLGFQKEAVCAALLQNQNNGDKALDSLLT